VRAAALEEARRICLERDLERDLERVAIYILLLEKKYFFK
jgi:hypothetical protein